jgi:hypothetical protein
VNVTCVDRIGDKDDGSIGHQHVRTSLMLAAGWSNARRANACVTAAADAQFAVWRQNRVELSPNGSRIGPAVATTLSGARQCRRRASIVSIGPESWPFGAHKTIVLAMVWLVANIGRAVSNRSDRADIAVAEVRRDFAAHDCVGKSVKDIAKLHISTGDEYTAARRT